MEEEWCEGLLKLIYSSTDIEPASVLAAEPIAL